MSKQQATKLSAAATMLLVWTGLNADNWTLLIYTSAGDTVRCLHQGLTKKHN